MRNPFEESGSHQPLWFAVMVRSNFERHVATAMRGKGIEEFSPMYQTKRRWSDRLKDVHLPLFAGYVFARQSWRDRLPILTIPGVAGLVSFGQTPAPIPEEEIENVRRILDSGLFATPWPFLKVGQRIKLVKGPLANLEGILAQVKGECRLIVTVSLLQRSVAVEVDGDWVKPVGSAGRAKSESVVPIQEAGGSRYFQSSL